MPETPDRPLNGAADAGVCVAAAPAAAGHGAAKTASFSEQDSVQRLWEMRPFGAVRPHRRRTLLCTQYSGFCRPPQALSCLVFIHLALPLFSTVKVPCQSAACLYNLRIIANSYRKVTIFKDTPEETARKSPLQNAAGFSIIKPDFAAAVPAALPILLFILEILRTLLILERRLFL